MKKNRKMSDIELLKEYQKVAKELVDAKDDELAFIGDHPNSDFWTDEQDEEYAAIQENISNLEEKFNTMNKIIDDRI